MSKTFQHLSDAHLITSIVTTWVRLLVVETFAN